MCGALVAMATPAFAEDGAGTSAETAETAEAATNAVELASSEIPDGSPGSKTIVVTATRTPTPITAIPTTVRVIDRDALDTQLAVSPSLLDSLAFSIPSLTPARQKLTSTGESLRGRTPLYLVDGIPQSTPLRDGKRSGFTIDPAFVDRVEVIFGANAIQGVGATGGVINYVTIEAPRDGQWLNRITVELTTDDFEDDGFHYRLSGVSGRRSGAFDFVAGAAFEKHGLFYGGNDRSIAVDTVQGELMDSTTWSVFGKFGFEPSALQRIEATVNLFRADSDGDYDVIPADIAAGIPASSVRGTPPGDPTFNDAVNLALSYAHDSVFGGELSLQGFYYDFYALYGGDTFPVFQDPEIAPIGTLFDQSALSSTKYGAKLTWVRQDALWRGLQVVAGADYLRDKSFQELAQTGRLWVPELIYRGWAPFVQLQQKLWDERLYLSGGARWENATLEVPDFTTIFSADRTSVEGGSPTFDKLLFNAGAVVEPIDGLKLFSSYAQGFTMPDAGLILRSVNTPGQTVEELVDLQPVVADNFELGAGWRSGGLDLSASYFWSNSDLGSRIQVIGGAGVVQRERTEIEGFEASASYAFPSGHRIGAAYAAIDGRFDSDGDEEVDRDLDGRNISPDRLNLFADGPLARSLRGRVQLSMLFDRDFEGGLPQFNFEGYTLVDAMLTCDANSVGRFTLAVSNLLDEEYLTYFSQTATFVNDRSFVLGRGRAFTLRWEGRF